MLVFCRQMSRHNMTFEFILSRQMLRHDTTFAVLVSEIKNLFRKREYTKKTSFAPNLQVSTIFIPTLKLT